MYWSASNLPEEISAENRRREYWNNLRRKALTIWESVLLLENGSDFFHPYSFSTTYFNPTQVEVFVCPHLWRRPFLNTHRGYGAFKINTVDVFCLTSSINEHLDWAPIYFQRWIIITFILYFNLSSIMIRSKIGMIRVKNQDNPSYSDFFLNYITKSSDCCITAQIKISDCGITAQIKISACGITAQKKYQPEKKVSEKTQHFNTLNLLRE